MNETYTVYPDGRKFTSVADKCGHKFKRLTYYAHLQQSEENEFPHLAMIGYGENNFKEYKCTGSLVSERWVISGAHCAKDNELGEAKYITLSILLKYRMRIFDIVRKVQHPSHENQKIEHDIILFEMNEPATLNQYILPICLPQSDDILTKTAIETGWRYIDFSSTLIKNSINYLPIATCQKEFEDNDDFLKSNFSNIICAGSNGQNFLSCRDNFGFQLQHISRHHYCMYTLSGIVAHGSTYCGKSVGAGTIYTNIFKYLDFIEATVWPGE